MIESPILSIKDLAIDLRTPRGVVHAVNRLSFAINPAECFALLGESGCGKSMSALSILQLLPMSANILSGSQIMFAGEDLLQWPEVKLRQIRGQRISMIFQEPMSSLNPVLTVGEQIDEVLKAISLRDKAERRDRIEDLLQQVGLDNPKQQSLAYPHQLSGGMKQRVMIAIALAGDPDLLIADEPTTALDVTIQAQILSLLKRLQEKNRMGLLLITHDLGVVQQMADQVGVMYAGHLVERAPASAFFRQPQHPYSQKLFDSLPSYQHRGSNLSVIRGGVPNLAKTWSGCRFAQRCPMATDFCTQYKPPIFNTEIEHEVRCHYYGSEKHRFSKVKNAESIINDHAVKISAEEKPESILQLQNLKIHFPIRKGIFKRTVGHVKAVDGVSLQLNRGETLAIVGESGSGKTTMGRGILQLLSITAGEVQCLHRDMKHLSTNQLRAARADMQMIFQDPFSSMNPRMTVGAIVEEGLRANRLCKSQRDYQARVSELLTQVGLPDDSALRYPNEFSGGQRQRICIARALAVKPKFIVCDEPTSALDVSVQAQILNLLKELQSELQLSYLFISHNVAVVSYIADRIAVMYKGKIVEQGSTEDILYRPQHEYTQRLLAAVPTINGLQ